LIRGWKLRTIIVAAEQVGAVSRNMKLCCLESCLQLLQPQLHSEDKSLSTLPASVNVAEITAIAMLDPCYFPN